MLETAEKITQLYEKYLASGGVVATDSRNVPEGSLFFALKGESFDGNRFVVSALRSGAAYAVADDPALRAGEGVEFADRIIPVKDCLTALQQLAAHHRYVLGLPVLAITGSNGKTTTKELMAQVLSCKFEVAVTRGNLNNHIGVPLTLLAMRPSAEFGIVEMGASAPEEIALLCRIAQPNYGLITNIGLAHLEGFGSLEGVKRGKGELYDYLAAHGGVAFYREEDQTLASMAAARDGLRAEPYSEVLGDIPSKLEGVYNRYNIAAAVAIGDYFGVARENSLAAIASYEPDNNRSQVQFTGRNRLVVDCYNANPSSMRAALENFSATRQPDYPQKVVILGDMLELGEWSESEHKAVLTMLSGENIDRAYLVGPNFERAARMAGTGACQLFPDVDVLSEYLGANPLAGADVLIKGSRGIRLEKIIGIL